MNEIISIIKYLKLFVGGQVEGVKVYMRKASFKPNDIPVYYCESMIEEEYSLDDFCFTVTVVSVCNPRCAI
ncbi:MAG: hypothetical protein HUJ51_02830 [Eggerthellaceae bacterium]|nr:hypothetical protein [Eggerthellaceae bacterium]